MKEAYHKQFSMTSLLAFAIIAASLLMTACNNKQQVPVDGGHGIGIDTATISALERIDTATIDSTTTASSDSATLGM